MKRKLYPGDKWLYVKIYASSVQCETLLITKIPQLISSLTKQSLIQKWFFIRYADPENHIRLRFLLSDTERIAVIMTKLLKCIGKELESDIISKIQYDTYTRELERYVENNIEDSESLFFTDSVITLRLLRAIRQYKGEEEERVAIACKSIDQLLSDFNYNIEQKADIINAISESFCSEFGYNEKNRTQLNDLFRKISPKIEPYFFYDKLPLDTFQKTICTIMVDRTSKQKDIISSIKRNLKYDEQIIQEIIRSYIHMMMNRLFSSQNRLYETLTYYFLKKEYISIMARQKQQAKQC